MSSNQPPWGNGPGWPPAGAPGSAGATPGTGPAAPSGGYPVPASPYGAPASPYAAPPAAPTGGQPVPPSPYGGPANPNTAPASPYGAPQGPYGAPASPYGAPQSPYGSPPAAPSPYGGPPASYGAPAPSADPYAAFAQSQPSGGVAPNPYAPPPGVDPYSAYARPAEFAGGQPVGGWLLFLCVSLTILNPLMTLSRLAPVLSRIAMFGPMFLVDVLVGLGLAGFSVYAGTGLWNRRTGAVRTAKVYFMVRGGWALLSYAMMFTGLSGVGISAIAPQGIFILAFCIVWFAYLANSQRVRATYGTQG